MTEPDVYGTGLCSGWLWKVIIINYYRKPFNWTLEGIHLLTEVAVFIFKICFVYAAAGFSLLWKYESLKCLIKWDLKLNVVSSISYVKMTSN